ncbi:hypothetical protein Sango_0346700 [Sesamum angolense]|uniref:Uncharacterized protein n=1 Tax=Sesamum angolense TaxID=2727404 RepID=A0AAE2C3G1_9LAMI|nr:hypothetical protein Sango_0346700 [Sesamum angolense]
MCPLRIILIFLSATLAGFFVVKNLKSPTGPQNEDVGEENEPAKAVPISSKVSAAVGKGFWTFVDMASGSSILSDLVNGIELVGTGLEQHCPEIHVSCWGFFEPSGIINLHLLPLLAMLTTVLLFLVGGNWSLEPLCLAIATGD